MSASYPVCLPRVVRRSLLIPCVAALLASASGCGGDAGPSSSAPPAGAPRSASVTDPSTVSKYDPQHPEARIETNLGTIMVRLDRETAPVTVQNFLNYIDAGFYRNTIFHFVDPGNMILGGGYSPDHQFKRPHSDIHNEADKGGKNLRGTIAMARNIAFIDSANSQFFINLQDAPQRDYRGATPDEYGYCVFGEVIEGLDVADRISHVPTADRSQLGEDLRQTPQPPVVISSIQIVR